MRQHIQTETKSGLQTCISQSQANSLLYLKPIPPRRETIPLIVFSNMATKDHKHKRSIEDTPLDLRKMKIVMKHLVSLKEELDGIQETEGEMEAVMKHVQALEKILENAKKPVCDAAL